MAPDPILQDRIYAALKADLRSGALLPQMNIDLQSVSARHRASVTPVREAICRLVGEGLAEFRPHGGFRVPRLRAEQLSDLYALNAATLAQALRAAEDTALDRAVRSFVPPPAYAGPAAIGDTVSTLFAGLALATGNSEYVRLVEHLSDRLAGARIAEAGVLKNMHGELAPLRESPEFGLRGAVSRLVARYHRRRLRHADPIADRLSWMAMS